MFHQQFPLFAFLDQVQGDLLHRARWWFWDHASIICSQSWPAIPYGEAPPLCGDDSLWGQSAFRQVAENTLQNCSAASLAWIALEITCLRAADSGCQGIKKWVFVGLIQYFETVILEFIWENSFFVDLSCLVLFLETDIALLDGFYKYCYPIFVVSIKENITCFL